MSDQLREYLNWKFGPGPFNENARPGLHDAVSGEYSNWCDCHPDSTQEDRVKAYNEIYENLKLSYPSYKERGTK